MFHQRSTLASGSSRSINRFRVLIAFGTCALACFAIAGSAQASTKASVSFSSNAAGSLTSAKIAVALTGSSGTISRVNVNLPTSLNVDLAALSAIEVCDPEVVQGPNPVDECPETSIFGRAKVKTPLSILPLTGRVIAYEAGGAAPGLALVATNESHTIESRTLLETALGSSASGSIIKLIGDTGDESPITALRFNLTGGISGQYLRIKAADYCLAEDALDATLTNAGGELSYAMSPVVNFTGCNTGGLITSGPATGSKVSGNTVSFNYHYTGANAFTGFRCRLERVSDELPFTQSVDCGTTATGSTKTYTGLAEGVYMFRVSTLGFAPAAIDVRKFQVN